MASSSPLRNRTAVRSAVAAPAMPSSSSSSSSTSTGTPPPRQLTFDDEAEGPPKVAAAATAAPVSNAKRKKSGAAPKAANDEATRENREPAKRAKTQKQKQKREPVPLAFPSHVPLPHRETVRAVFEEVVARQQLSDADAPTFAPSGEGGGVLPLPPEQSSLRNAGLLSFAEVLLPAAAHEPDAALKRLEGLARRDYASSLNADAVTNVRKALIDGMKAAIKAAQSSRHVRLERDWERQKNRRVQDALEKLERQQLRQARRPQRLREAQRRLPRNQDTYREQAHLMHELAQLERDERLWIDAARALELRQHQESEQVEEIALERSAANDDGDIVAPSDGALDHVAAVRAELQSLEVSASRMEAAVQVVERLLAGAEQTRQKLYQAYRDKQFAGYPGIRDPKGLLKALSQSQTQSSSLSQGSSDEVEELCTQKWHKSAAS